MSLLVVTFPIAIASELNLIYDQNGNLVTGDSLYREYNQLNQLVTIKEGNTSTGNVINKFVYHPVEERVLIKDIYYNGIYNSSIYYVSDEFIRIENSSGNFTEKYVYQDDVLVAQVDSNGNKQSVHNDHLGSVSLLADSDGNTLENNYFSPYGEQLTDVDARYSFTGKEKDEQTGEYDFNARMYKGEWGRFLKPDPLFYNLNLPEKQRTVYYYIPQRLNPYTYVENNPYKYIDPTGQIIKSAFKIIKRLKQALSKETIAATETTVGSATDLVPVGQKVESPSDVSNVQLGGAFLDVAMGIVSPSAGLLMTFSDLVAASYDYKSFLTDSDYGLSPGTFILEFILDDEEKDDDQPVAQIRKEIHIDENGNQIIYHIQNGKIIKIEGATNPGSGRLVQSGDGPTHTCYIEACEVSEVHEPIVIK